MGEATGYKAAGRLPKTLEDMLNVLLEENGLRSWQIYTDNLGVSCRIRFGHCSSVAGSSHVVDKVASSTMSHTTAPSKPKHTAYARKSPAQLRRETTRIILRAKKRQRTLDEHFVNIETERHEECEISSVPSLFDLSPITVSCDPSKDHVFFQAPITPIKLDKFDNETTCKMQYKAVASPVVAEVDIPDAAPQMPLCSCCDKEMMDAFHVCSDNSDASSEDSVITIKTTSASKVSDVPTRVEENVAKRFAKLIALEIFRPPDKP